MADHISSLEWTSEEMNKNGQVMFRKKKILSWLQALFFKKISCIYKNVMLEIDPFNSSYS